MTAILVTAEQDFVLLDHTVHDGYRSVRPVAAQRCEAGLTGVEPIMYLSSTTYE